MYDDWRHEPAVVYDHELQRYKLSLSYSAWVLGLDDESFKEFLNRLTEDLEEQRYFTKSLNGDDEDGIS